MARIQLIVGLQNPGTSYAQTRHNVGAWLVRTYAHQHALSFQTEKKFHADIAVATMLGVQGVRMLLPLTFMNHSGQPVRALCQFYKILPNEVLVVHDDLDIAVGRVVFKTGGGHGGHNGLRDIIAHLGTSDFHRLRIGIGHPGDRAKVHDYVLSAPSKLDQKNIIDAIEKTLTVLPKICEGHFSDVMTVLNQRERHGI